MVLVRLYGRMEKNMLGNMLRIKKKGRGLLNGLMGKNILEIGVKGSKMVKEYLLIKKVRKERVCGKTVKELNGLMNDKYFSYYLLYILESIKSKKRNDKMHIYYICNYFIINIKIQN